MHVLDVCDGISSKLRMIYHLCCVLTQVVAGDRAAASLQAWIQHEYAQKDMDCEVCPCHCFLGFSTPICVCQLCLQHSLASNDEDCGSAICASNLRIQTWFLKATPTQCPGTWLRHQEQARLSVAFSCASLRARSHRMLSPNLIRS